jgi:hypothetical protein
VLDRKIKLVLICLVFAFLRTEGQNQIEVQYQRTTDNKIVFYGTNRTYAPYTVWLNFSTLVNLSSDNPRGYTVLYPGTNRLCSLAPTSTSQTNFGYSYVYRLGCYPTKPDTTITYLFPLKHGKKTTVQELSHLAKISGGGVPKDWYALSFKTEYGDTICAARKGVVIEVIDNLREDDRGTVMYAKERNYVLVKHEDCTIARYELLKEEGSLVKEGQNLMAGDFLGIIGGKGYSSGSHLRFSVHYLYLQGSNPKDENTIAYVPVKFNVDDSKVRLSTSKTYTSLHKEETIQQEMNKREIKKWRERNFPK